MRRRFSNKKKELVLNLKEFHPSGDYRFFVPEGCYEMDVFLVGGGAGGGNGYATPAGGGSGYTKTYKKSNESSGSWNDWVKDGDAIKVKPGQEIVIYVGKGGAGGIKTGGRAPKYGSDGEDTSVHFSFEKRLYASGGKAYKGEKHSDGYAICASGGTGASEAGGWGTTASASFSDGHYPTSKYGTHPGDSQGHTTRVFGEIDFLPTAGGTSGCYGNEGKDYPHESEGYYTGRGQDGDNWSSPNDTYPASEGGGGYGGGGGAGGIQELSGSPYGSGKGGDGGDGVVILRYYSKE